MLYLGILMIIRVVTFETLSSPAVAMNKFSPRSSKRERQSGSAIIEMGLLFPVLFIMLCGTMDFARVFYAGIAISSAARAGVQYGSYSPSNAGNLTGMQNAATTDASNQGLTGVTA